jgi:hypothetical protein
MSSNEKDAAGTVVFWRPSPAWHVKVLAGIYLFLLVFFLAVDAWLSRLPEPYRLREVPAEMTPWLKR